MNAITNLQCAVRWRRCLCALMVWQFLAAAAWCAPGCRETAAQHQDDEAQITRLLTDQAQAWNAGRLEDFMQGYWKSDQLSFSTGGSVLRGWQATMDRYRRRYGTGEQMGDLRFDHLEITMLGDAAAMVLGQWHLRHNNESMDGNFTLVLRQIDGHWKIIHDHTSLREADDD